MQKQPRLVVFVCLAIAGVGLATWPTPALVGQERGGDFVRRARLLNRQELDVWQAYLHADNQTAYDRVVRLLETPEKLSLTELRIALVLQQLTSTELGYEAKRSADLERFIPKLQNDAIRELLALGPRQDVARHELTKALLATGRVSDAEVESAKLGYLKNWFSCGPFSNERGQGFEELLEPENTLSLSKSYSGKDEQAVAFKPLPVVPMNGTVDLGTVCRPKTEAVAYLVTAIKLEEPAPFSQMFISSDGPFKVWTLRSPNHFATEDGRNLLDGLLATEELERPFGFDQNQYRLSRLAEGRTKTMFTGLAKGWNVILIKTAATDSGWRFSARLKAESTWREAAGKGELVAALSAPGPELAEAGGRGGSDWGVRDTLLGGISEVLAPALDRNSNQKTPSLLKILKVAQELTSGGNNETLGDDNEVVLTFLLAEASKSTSRVASGKEENKRRELLEQVLKLDPKAARAALELAKYYSGTFRNPTEADRYAKMAVELAPRWVEARVFAARVATMKGLDGEVERELAALLKEHPDHPSVLRFAGYYRGVRGDYKGSDELFKRCLYKGDFTDSYCRERLFTRAVERNDTDAALQYANETRQLNPFDLASSEGLIQLFLATGYLERAMAECERALNICPREDKFLARKGEIYMRMAAREPAKAADFKAKAIAAYRESLKCNPNNEDLARYLEFLADEKPVWEVKLQENIEARIEAALKLPVEGNDPYRVIYRDEITVVNDDGTKSIYFQYAYRICNDDGREVLQELGAPAYADQVGRCVGARVYRRDGGTEEGRRVESTAMLPPLDIGDIVAVRYRVSDTAQSFFGDFFGASEALGDFVPVDEVRLVYVLPKSRKFFEYVQHGAAPALKREEGDKAIWTYSAKNLARVPREGMQLPLEQIVPTVQISTYENWKEFGRWYYNLIKKQLEPTPEMKAKVASLIEGKTSERDKARAIYNWVVTNIRYNADWHFGVHGYKPFSAGAIFERCIGDCKDKAIVICTMLGIAGVKAYPVLIRLADSSDPRGRENITLPMPHHFNHAIAYIEYGDGKGQFVDGTATFNGFDELPGSDAGANVVIVRPEGGVQTQVPIPKAAENSTREDIALEFLGNGKLKLTVKLTAKGDRASYLRAIYLQPGTRATQLESQWARHKPGAKVIKVEANDLANIDLPPVITYEIEVPDAYTTDAQGNIELAVALNPLLWGKGLAATTTRRTDIAQSAPYEWQSVLTFKAPAGMKLEKFPTSYLEDALGTTLWVSVEQIDREYSISRTYSTSGGVIEAKDYPKLREMLLAFDRAEAAKLKLVKEK